MTSAQYQDAAPRMPWIRKRIVDAATSKVHFFQVAKTARNQHRAQPWSRGAKIHTALHQVWNIFDG